MIITYNKNDNDDGARGVVMMVMMVPGVVVMMVMMMMGMMKMLEHTEHDDKTMLNHHSKMRSRGGMRMRMMLNLYQMQRSVKLSFLYFSLLIAITSHGQMDSDSQASMHQKQTKVPMSLSTAGKGAQPISMEHSNFLQVGKQHSCTTWIVSPYSGSQWSRKLQACSRDLIACTKCVILQTANRHQHALQRQRIWYTTTQCDAGTCQGLWEWGIVGLDLSEKWHFLEDIHYDIYIYCMV